MDKSVADFHLSMSSYIIDTPLVFQIVQTNKSMLLIMKGEIYVQIVFVIHLIAKFDGSQLEQTNCQ